MPRVVTVYVGQNEPRDRSDFSNNVEELVTRNRAEGVRTVLVTYPDGALIAPWLDERNAKLAELGRRHGIDVLDAAALLGERQWLFTADRVHPNQWGHAIIASRLTEVIESALRETAELP